MAEGFNGGPVQEGIEGAPMVDGVDVVSMEEGIDGVPMEEDIDGLPMTEEDTDGAPMDISSASTPLPPYSPGAAPRSLAVIATTSDATNQHTAPSTPAPAQINPKKRGAKTLDDGAADDGSPKKKAKSTPAKASPTKRTPAKATPSKDRQRKAPIQVASARPIGASYEECSDFDKNLIDMRDAGRTWVDIRKEWQKLTGDSVGQSTLPNRYSRLKDNFTNIKDEDNPKLLAAKEKVEAAFERNKWAMIADTVKKMGGDTYGPNVLQRQYKKLMVGEGAIPPAGVKYKDFDIDIDQDE